VLAYVGLQVKL